MKPPNSGSLRTRRDGSSNLFTYIVQEAAPTYPSANIAFKMGKTSCRSIALTFAAVDNSNSGETNDTGYAEVVQTSLDKQPASAPLGSVGHLPTKLDGGPWQINIATTLGQTNWFDTGLGDTVVLNGKASCWSSSGKQ